MGTKDIGVDLTEKYCSQCKNSKYVEVEGKVKLFCTRERLRGYSPFNNPGGIFFKSLSSKACVYFDEK